MVKIEKDLTLIVSLQTKVSVRLDRDVINQAFESIDGEDFSDETIEELKRNYIVNTIKFFVEYPQAASKILNTSVLDVQNIEVFEGLQFKLFDDEEDNEIIKDNVTLCTDLPKHHYITKIIEN